MEKKKIDNSKKMVNNFSKVLKGIEFNNDEINDKKRKIINRFNVIDEKKEDNK